MRDMRQLAHIFLACAMAYQNIPAFFRNLPVDLFVTENLLSEKEPITDAAASWNNLLGKQAIRLWWESAKSSDLSTVVSNPSTEGTSTIFASYGGGRWEVMRSVTSLGAQLHGDIMYNVAAHEFGHLLGLNHTRTSPIMGMLLVVDGVTGAPIPAARILLTADDRDGVLAAVAERDAQPPPPTSAPAFPLYPPFATATNPLAFTPSLASPAAAQAFPAASQAFPAASQAFPAASQAYPAASQAFPMASQAFPMASQAFPAMSQAFPVAFPAASQAPQGFLPAYQSPQTYTPAFQAPAFAASQAFTAGLPAFSSIRPAYYSTGPAYQPYQTESARYGFTPWLGTRGG